MKLTNNNITWQKLSDTSNFYKGVTTDKGTYFIIKYSPAKNNYSLTVYTAGQHFGKGMFINLTYAQLSAQDELNNLIKFRQELHDIQNRKTQVVK